MRRREGKVGDVALCGMLLAVMLILGYVESILPMPTAIPGIKLGLSNGVLIFAVYMLGIGRSWILMVLKVLLSSLMFGSMSTMMYALAGGVLSLAVMQLFHLLGKIHPVAVSMAGGAFHNIGQVLMAMLVLKTPLLTYYMAVLIVVGLVTGAATGVAATAVMKHMKGFVKREESSTRVDENGG